VSKSDPSTARCINSLAYRTAPINSFDAESAAHWLRERLGNLIAFGRKFIANPDLPVRLRIGAPLNVDDSTTYYSGGEKGYTDYPSLEQDRGNKPKACVDQR
jgi:N-ethylmaleimide reductase